MPWKPRRPCKSFTFHNVSINTKQDPVTWNALPDFTFHNVSINTEKIRASREVKAPLHSTMFLLIHLAAEINRLVEDYFTFHNVSINTEDHTIELHINSNFTFHNVSINTHKQQIQLAQKYQTLHSTMFLLILEQRR